MKLISCVLIALASLCVLPQFAGTNDAVAPTVIDPKGKIAILFDGEISSILGENETDPEGKQSFSNASFGISFDNNYLYVAGLIRVVDAQKNRTTNYAIDLYNSKGSEKFGGLLEFRVKNALKPIDLNGYIGFGSNTWMLQEGQFLEYSNREFQATVVSFGLNLMLAMEKTIGENEVFGGVFVGGGYKGLSGNIGFSKYDDLRTQILGSERKSFLGIEGGAVFQFNSIKGSLMVTSYGGEIEDFSRTRVMASIGIETRILKLGGD